MGSSGRGGVRSEGDQKFARMHLKMDYYYFHLRGGSACVTSVEEGVPFHISSPPLHLSFTQLPFFDNPIFDCPTRPLMYTHTLHLNTFGAIFSVLNMFFSKFWSFFFLFSLLRHPFIFNFNLSLGGPTVYRGDSSTFWNGTFWKILQSFGTAKGERERR